MNYLIIALGGGIGSALRYAVSKFVQDSTNGRSLITLSP